MSDQPQPLPEAFLEGSFALYWLQNGDLVIAYRKKHHQETERLVMPAYMISMAQSLSGGANPMDMIKKIASP